MDKFQELLTEAAQLKEAQLKNERKNYQSLPDYIKSGLNYSRKYELLRRQDYMIQMSISERLKKAGNELFKIEQYQQALNRYEESLGIFRYIVAKSYDNMKDDDLAYENYTLPQSSKEYANEYSNHLIALYLNICSCLTKLNKKEDAIHSADEALKINETAKGYYKKAQAYLQYINKEASDIKLGFYYLNKSYQLSKDPSIVQQMHKIKKEIDEERDKEKKWFKFMFDKNSQAKKEQENAIEPPKKEQPKEEVKTKKEGVRAKELKNFQRQKGQQLQKEDVRLEKTKEKLSKYLDKQLSEEEWLQIYEGQFIAKHGSKIYSIIQLYGYKQYLGQYKSLLAQCLEFRKEEEQFMKRKQLYSKYFQWLKDHPIDKIAKYTERYDLQTKWIRQQRQKKQGQDFPIESEQSKNKQIEMKPVFVPEPVVTNEKEQSQQLPLLVESNIKQSEIPQAGKQEEQTFPQSESTTPQAISSDQKNLKLFSFLAALVIVLILKFVI